jgi:tRNA threonylcarbamoyladenosine biosynthesis protein TsaB
LLAGIAPEVFVIERAAPDPVAVCALAAGRTTPARPLYLRAPDAKLPGGRELGGRDLVG